MTISAKHESPDATELAVVKNGILELIDGLGDVELDADVEEALTTLLEDAEHARFIAEREDPDE